MKPPAPVTQTVWPWHGSDEVSTGMFFLYVYYVCVFGGRTKEERQREGGVFLFS